MENASVQRGLFLTFRLLSLIRHALRRATFPGGEGCLPAGAAYTGPGLNFQGSPPHPARATPGPPSPSRRGLEPLIRHALRRATFPVGEGDLRRGLYTLSWERVAGRSPDGCGAGPSLQQGDPSVSLRLTAPFTQGSLPLFRRIPSPLLLGEGAARRRRVWRGPLNYLAGGG